MPLSHTTMLLPSVTMAGAVGSFILDGIAVRRATAGPKHTAAQRIAARICLVVAPVIMLAGLVALFLCAQLIVGLFSPAW
jgi:hypothetical protein